MPDSAIRHQNASPSEKGKVTICDGKSSDEDRPKKSSVCKSIDGCQEELLAQVVRKYFVLFLLLMFCCLIFLWYEKHNYSTFLKIYLINVLHI